MTILSKLIVGFLLITGAGGIWHYTSKPKVASEELQAAHSTSTAAVTSTSTDSKQKKMAFSDFIKNGGGSYKCTVNQSVQNITSKGTVYISNQMMAGNFSISYASQNITSNFIVKGGYSYSWSSAAPTMGFKVKAAASSEFPMKGAPASAAYSFDPNYIGDYNCEAWPADSATFSLPSGVTFRALN